MLVLWASSSHIVLPRVTSCFHEGNFLAQQENLLVPGTTARHFLRALLHSLVLHCASFTAHNKMAAVKKGMRVVLGASTTRMQSVNINKMKLTAEEKRY